MDDLAPWKPDGVFDPQASVEDIYYCFRLLLGRNPSPAEWPGHSGLAGNELRSIVRSYLDSREFAERGLLGPQKQLDVQLTKAEGFSIYTSQDDLAVGKHVAAGVYEPAVADLFRSILKPGMGVIDLGANIGFFSMLAASLVGPQGFVLAVEPNLANVRMLEASRRANGFRHVTVAACGAGTAPGLLTLNTAFSNGMTGPVGDELADLMTAQIVPCMPVSALLPTDRGIDFIKIDVEGAEHLVLSAARDIIAKWHPTIVSEFSPGLLEGNSGVSGEQYLEFFADLGYRASVVDGRMDAPAATVAEIMAAYRRSGDDHIDILLVPATPATSRSGWRRLLGG